MFNVAYNYFNTLFFSCLDFDEHIWFQKIFNGVGTFKKHIISLIIIIIIDLFDISEVNVYMRGHPWYSSSALGCWSTDRAIDPAPGNDS